MCGIFGIIRGDRATRQSDNFARAMKGLASESASRGKEASGFIVVGSEESQRLSVFKSALSSTELVRKDSIKKIIQNPATELMIGHARLVTNGSQQEPQNNQPIVTRQMALVHNGIIVNTSRLWADHPDLLRESEVDSEFLAKRLEAQINSGIIPSRALAQLFGEISGTASIAAVLPGCEHVVLATNCGSLYYSLLQNGSFCFASERHILEVVFGGGESITVQRLEPHTALLVQVSGVNVKTFDLRALPTNETTDAPVTPITPIVHVVGGNSKDSLPVTRPISTRGRFENLFHQVMEATRQLKRCARCVLPETVPFIEFDPAGVCNFCRSYVPNQLLGEKAFLERVAPFRKKGSTPDVILALSGGRDSCYGLHRSVKDFGLKPITYTYDWGLVTDLARRNISRMCSQLGVENIIISADINWKRENVRRNIVAWMKRPHLGMVPLFMAGDKEFIWFAQRIKKQNQIDLDIFTFNLLEKTQFKEEFTGIQMWKPGKDSDKFGEDLGLWGRIRLASFYGFEVLKNPAYINRSLRDTFQGYLAYYYFPKTFVSFFNYFPWNEDKINHTLTSQYEWETATDSKSTWRIGDGTAAFYNYIYYLRAGFTENDTLRSNQVREGDMARERALELVYQDNLPRWESLQWYFGIIGLDPTDCLKRLHEMEAVHPKLERARVHGCQELSFV
jgi:glucosamine--fructose-6-phosphate aminotransferase (isomerizing)